MTTFKVLAQNILDIQEVIQAKTDDIQEIERSIEDLKTVFKEAEAALSAALFNPADEYDGPIAIDLGDKVLVCNCDGEGSWSMKSAIKY